MSRRLFIRLHKQGQDAATASCCTNTDQEQGQGPALTPRPPCPAQPPPSGLLGPGPALRLYQCSMKQDRARRRRKSQWLFFCPCEQDTHEASPPIVSISLVMASENEQATNDAQLPNGTWQSLHPIAEHVPIERRWSGPVAAVRGCPGLRPAVGKRDFSD
ncbi:hypothetical protein MRS44_006892 [Fusarium solani]|uniref:uncharacterized protein n=1 Tax=Fusarium solani TaxID=169388 RepID=UPI0032C437F8|nr:hypothetical protein MRS44_006892 [Fusarium solani]